jgi:hypothetical protein
MIPKLSAPLSKAIRTSEGIAVWAINIALGIAAAIPNTHLTVKEAGILATITTGLHVASRTALKITAVAKAAGLPPIAFAPSAALAAGVADAPALVTYAAEDAAKAPSVDEAIAQAQTVVTDVQAIDSPPVPAPPEPPVAI